MKRKQGWKWWFLGVVSLLSLAGLGCVPVLSEAVRQQADPSVTFAALRENPDAYKDRMVILGGAILRCRNEDMTTYLEVLQHPLGRSEKPSSTDDTEGRFLLSCDTYLDPAVYTKGRLITAAARVVGAHSGRIGEMAYTYPLLACQELYLWSRPVSSPESYDPDLWWDEESWIYPWHWGHPWYW